MKILRLPWELIFRFDIERSTAKQEAEMSCPLCLSNNQMEFPAEIAVHFSSLINLNRPGPLVFPKLLVCLDCGFAGFTLAESELRLLREDKVASEAAEVTA